ncbi:MAG: GTP-binding protein [Patescibacteria group bacterium]|nr:GTP-binding protein [Patescibacteria group bacterium]MCL5257914.1 GTP-binding protein [Patescibacteria group bacterium]
MVKVKAENLKTKEEKKIVNLKTRPPIVTILGHVDQGKTTLLDYLRQTKVAEKEVGGITQRIGADEIKFSFGPNKELKRITFIDTPGHEIFTKLRERGAAVADFVLLLIAIDDGVKPQTIESIEFLKAFELPFIVVLNKIDKKGFDPNRIFQNLNDRGVVVEDWGGNVPVVKISAKTGENIDQLLEMITIMAELKELNYDPDQPASGFVLEAVRDAQKGIIVSVVIQAGRLEIGDSIATATASAKVKFMENNQNQRLDLIEPSAAALIGGFKNLPLVGEIFRFSTEASLNEVQSNLIEEEAKTRQKYIIGVKPNLSQAETDEDVYWFNLKADSLGSLEALEKIIRKIGQEKNLNFKIVKADLGLIGSDDLRLIKSDRYFLVAFNIRTNKEVRDQIKDLKINFFDGDVIYELENKVTQKLEKANVEAESAVELNVLAVFNRLKNKQTIGGEVVSGPIKSNQSFKIIRAEAEIGVGKILSLEKDKKSTRQINQGLGGFIVGADVEIKTGDRLVVK